MIDRDLLKMTVYLSIIVQILTGLVSFSGVFVKLNDKDKILTEILGLETVVQIVEGLFYIYLAYSLQYISTYVVARRRYIDWIITTPMMLLSTIMYMDYEKKKKENKTIRARSFIKNNRKNITNMFLANTLMLIAGFLAEIKLVSKSLAIPVGFVFLFLSFGIMYQNYVGDIEINKKIFTFMLGIWSLYGVAAMAPTLIKNISYNMLDIVAKNFYGLFIFFKIKEVSEASRRI